MRVLQIIITALLIFLIAGLWAILFQGRKLDIYVVTIMSIFTLMGGFLAGLSISTLISLSRTKKRVKSADKIINQALNPKIEHKKL